MRAWLSRVGPTVEVETNIREPVRYSSSPGRLGPVVTGIIDFLDGYYREHSDFLQVRLRADWPPGPLGQIKGLVFWEGCCRSWVIFPFLCMIWRAFLFFFL